MTEQLIQSRVDNEGDQCVHPFGEKRDDPRRLNRLSKEFRSQPSTANEGFRSTMGLFELVLVIRLNLVRSGGELLCFRVQLLSILAERRGPFRELLNVLDGVIR